MNDLVGFSLGAYSAADEVAGVEEFIDDMSSEEAVGSCKEGSLGHLDV